MTWTKTDEDTRTWLMRQRLALLLEAEARADGNAAKQDIEALHQYLAAGDAEMASFFAGFARFKARDAATFARLALEYREGKGQPRGEIS